MVCEGLRAGVESDWLLDERCFELGTDETAGESVLRFSRDGAFRFKGGGETGRVMDSILLGAALFVPATSAIIPLTGFLEPSDEAEAEPTSALTRFRGTSWFDEVTSASWFRLPASPNPGMISTGAWSLSWPKMQWKAVQLLPAGHGMCLSDRLIVTRRWEIRIPLGARLFPLSRDDGAQWRVGQGRDGSRSEERALARCYCEVDDPMQSRARGSADKEHPSERGRTG